MYSGGQDVTALCVYAHIINNGTEIADVDWPSQRARPKHRSPEVHSRTTDLHMGCSLTEVLSSPSLLPEQ